MSYLLEQSADGTDMVLTAAWSADAESCLRDGRADGVVLNYARGFQGPDIGFLHSLPVRRVALLARWVGDLSPVESLASSLVSLSVECSPKAVLDLSALPRLERLAAPWAAVRRSFDSASPALRDLFLLSYSEADFRPVAGSIGLRSLRLKHYPNVRSLDGLQSLSDLGRLHVYSGRRLADISALGEAPRGLSDLALGACRKIGRLDSLAGCAGLRRLDLSEDGDIESLAPLGALSYMEELFASGDTKVADADLGPLLGLPRLRTVSIRPRPQYRPPLADVLAAIGLDPSAFTTGRGR